MWEGGVWSGQGHLSLRRQGLARALEHKECWRAVCAPQSTMCFHASISYAVPRTNQTVRGAGQGRGGSQTGAVQVKSQVQPGLVRGWAQLTPGRLSSLGTEE